MADLGFADEADAGKRLNVADKLSDADIRLCVDALWDNLKDGGIADRFFDSDFDKAEVALELSFRRFLSDRDG